VSPVKYELGFYIPEDAILLHVLSLSDMFLLRSEYLPEDVAKQNYENEGRKKRQSYGILRAVP
jgi:hypothetical protein